jgi:hypothetical protein
MGLLNSLLGSVSKKTTTGRTFNLGRQEVRRIQATNGRVGSHYPRMEVPAEEEVAVGR